MNKKTVYIASIFLISSCSSIDLEKEKILNVFSWDDKPNQNISLKNAIKFNCAEDKNFHLKFLEDKNAVWIILENREFRLNKDANNDNAYSNGKSLLKINSDNTTIESNKKIVYDQCKEEKPI